jgi:hypothetical protein
MEGAGITSGVRGPNAPHTPAKRPIETGNALTAKVFFFGPIWSRQRFSRFQRGLARECTRYAHNHPQEMWTTASVYVRRPVGIRELARLSTVSPTRPSNGGDDVANPRG